MNDQQSIEFYDQESSQYSKKRYEGREDTYIQYSFRRRLAIALDLIKRVASELDRGSLLEIGCADGIVMRRIYTTFPDLFRRYTGIDISPEMIETARIRSNMPNSRYFVRGVEPRDQHNNLVIELGVHVHDIEAELDYVYERLTPGGYFIFSVSAPTSLYSRMKRNKIAESYLPYRSYRNALSKKLEIVRCIPCGFFVPKLWSMPLLARILQPIIERLLAFMPDLYHEQVYLLRKRSV